MANGYVKSCLIQARAGDAFPFQRTDDGTVSAFLDSYAVIPVEDYLALCATQGFCPVDHWPCQLCGAEGPDENDHDPCIANLPGVAHACCGHGLGEGYVMFEDGRVLRGHFEGHAARPTPGEGDGG